MKRQYAIVIIFMMIVGCASWQENAVTVYEGIGDSMVVVRDAMKSACNEGIISISDCEKLKMEYNEIEKLRKEAGGILSDIIEIEDSLKTTTDLAKRKEILANKEVVLSQYNKLIGDINKLLQDLLKNAKESGVKL